MNTNQIFIEQVSPFDVTTTVEKLIASASQKEWQNPAVHNLQQSFAKEGNVMRPVQVIELCKQEYSGFMHEKNRERVASILTMPCRISVYEKDDGMTYVSLFNMAAMITGLTSSENEIIRDASHETIEIVKSVIGEIKE